MVQKLMLHPQPPPNLATQTPLKKKAEDCSEGEGMPTHAISWRIGQLFLAIAGSHQRRCLLKVGTPTWVKSTLAMSELWHTKNPSEFSKFSLLLGASFDFRLSSLSVHVALDPGKPAGEDTTLQEGLLKSLKGCHTNRYSMGAWCLPLTLCWYVLLLISLVFTPRKSENIFTHVAFPRKC